MHFRRVAIRALAAGVAAIAMVTADPASATYPTFVRITAGGQMNGTPITFTAINQNVLAIKILQSGLVFKCPIGGVRITGTTTVATSPSVGSNNPAAYIPINGTTFHGCKLNNLDLSIMPTQSWRLRANNPSSASGGPVSGQRTPGEVNSLLADVAIGTCTAKIGFGTAVTYPSAGAAGIIDESPGGGVTGSYGLTYTNGNPSTVQLYTTPLTTGANAAKIGINSTSIPGGCFAGTVRAGYKVQLYGLATLTSSTPVNVVFDVTANVTGSGAAANPLWVAA